MKKLAAITFTSMVLLVATAMVVGAVDNVEVRGHVATDSDSWNANNFAGFYYDLKNDIKSEELTTTITDNNKLMEPDGVKYTATAKPKDFEFEDWGQYNVIGFMGEKYFAGYLDKPDTTDDVLYEKSTDENVLSDEQLLKILRDEETKIIIKKGQSIKLDEGYELFFQGLSVDDGQIYLELKKNGK